MKKKIFALLMGAVMCMGCMGLGECSSDENSLNGSNSSNADNSGTGSENSDSSTDSENSSSSAAGNSDWDYISNKGEVVVGITYYEPMNYFDENGELVGFETEFTKAVCEKLGVTPVFQEIEWEKKEVELQSKAIDLIWNGLTVTEDRKENMAFSKTYLNNKQVIIVKTENADKYTDTASMAGTSIAFESGSAGEDAAKADETLAGCELIGCSAQKDALLEVKAGTADLGILDYTLAKASIGEGTDYADMQILDSVELASEQYAVGVRLEDTETLAKINNAIDELAQDGTLLDIAKKYGVDDIYAL